MEKNNIQFYSFDRHLCGCILQLPFEITIVFDQGAECFTSVSTLNHNTIQLVNRQGCPSSCLLHVQKKLVLPPPLSYNKLPISGLPRPDPELTTPSMMICPENLCS